MALKNGALMTKEGEVTVVLEMVVLDLHESVKSDVAVTFVFVNSTNGLETLVDEVKKVLPVAQSSICARKWRDEAEKIVFDTVEFLDSMVIFDWEVIFDAAKCNA